MNDSNEKIMLADAKPTASLAGAVKGEKAAGQIRNIGTHLARLLVRGSVGGMPSGEPPKCNNDCDNHWWREILGSLREFQQAIKGASRKQVMRELLKNGFTEAQLEEIAKALPEAAKLMGEDTPPFLP